LLLSALSLRVLETLQISQLLVQRIGEITEDDHVSDGEKLSTSFLERWEGLYLFP